MIRTSTWENLGTQATSNHLLNLLEEADLNYKAVAKDMFIEYEGSPLLIPGKKMVIREDTGDPLGIVSDKYQICQNYDALDYVEHIDGIELQRAGQLGSMVWMIGKLPEVSVLGDTVTPHLIFQNSHDGSCSVKSTICMLRIVCQNQFVASFRESPATITIRHQGDLEEKLLVAKQTMEGVYDYVKNYNAVAEELSTQKVTPQKLNQIIEGYFKISEEMSERSKVLVMNRRERFWQAYDEEDNQNFKGTQWGVINAYSDFITHEEAARKTSTWEENRFYYSLNPSTMNEFMKFVEAA